MPETPSNPATKAALRRELIAYRQGIDIEVRRRWDAAICAHLLDWHAANPVRLLGVYSAIRGEPDLSAAYAQLSARGVQLALPVVTGKNAPLTFVAWKPGDPMEKDGYGVAVPVTKEPLQPEALLIPCVGFNAQGFRLGYGGGFYDRTLAITPRPYALGVAYSAARAEFAGSDHDVRMDRILTEA